MFLSKYCLLLKLQYWRYIKTKYCIPYSYICLVFPVQNVHFVTFCILSPRGIAESAKFGMQTHKCLLRRKFHNVQLNSAPKVCKAAIGNLMPCMYFRLGSNYAIYTWWQWKSQTLEQHQIVNPQCLALQPELLKYSAFSYHCASIPLNCLLLLESLSMPWLDVLW